jgi:hypothetical protein
MKLFEHPQTGHGSPAVAELLKAPDETDEVSKTGRRTLSPTLISI